MEAFVKTRSALLVRTLAAMLVVMLVLFAAVAWRTDHGQANDGVKPCVSTSTVVTVDPHATSTILCIDHMRATSTDSWIGSD